jgi:type IV secretory pathway TrbL component
MPFLVSILVTLVIAGLVLWAVQQFPMDPTIARVIRVVVVCAVVLWLIGTFFGFPGGWEPHYRYR